MATAKEKLSKLREHNHALYKGDKVGTLKETEVTSAYEENLESFAKQVLEARQGKLVDEYGRKLSPNDISLPVALSACFGIIAPEKGERGEQLTSKQKDMFVIKHFLKQMQVFSGSDTLFSTAQRFGNDNLTVSGLESLLVKHSEFDAVNNTNQINPDFRFIIPELILAAIRVDYEAAAQYQNWIANTVNISQRKITMPQILRGSAIPKKVGEAESIPFGTVKFGQKEATVYKVGTGFKITDELVESSTLDLLFEFLGEVGIEMSIGADAQAAAILINGEQASGIESAPVVGVDDTTDGITFLDIKRVITRMLRLKRNANRILTGENDGIGISLLDEFKGFAGDKVLMSITNMFGIPANLQNDVFPMPNNQVMFLAPNDAMIRLQYRSMKTERRRNPQTQTDELFVSDYIGFAIKRRDGRVILDKSLAFASYGFPAYMDVDSRINQAFKSWNE